MASAAGSRARSRRVGAGAAVSTAQVARRGALRLERRIAPPAEGAGWPTRMCARWLLGRVPPRWQTPRRAPAGEQSPLRVSSALAPARLEVRLSARRLSEPPEGRERAALPSRSSARIGRPSARRRRTRRLVSPRSVHLVRGRAGRGVPGPRPAISRAPRPRAQARRREGPDLEVGRCRGRPARRSPPRGRVRSAFRSRGPPAGSRPGARDDVGSRGRHVSNCTDSRTLVGRSTRPTVRARTAGRNRRRGALPARPRRVRFSRAGSPPAPSRGRSPHSTRGHPARGGAPPASRPGSGRCPSGSAPPRPPPAAPRQARPRAVPS